SVNTWPFSAFHTIRESGWPGDAFRFKLGVPFRTKGPRMATGASLHIGLSAVDPKHYSKWDGYLTCSRLARHESERELHSFGLRTRTFMFVAAASMLFGGVGYGQSDPSAANSGGLDFKQFGLLAIQDGG